MNALVLGWRRARRLSFSSAPSSRFDEPAGVIALVCLWMAAVGNVALWRELYGLSLLHGLSGLALVLGLAVAVSGALALVCGLLAWRWTLKPVLVVMLMVTAACSHFMRSYGIVIDPSMMVNVLQTDPHEAADLFSTGLLVNLVLMGVLPAVWVLRRPVRFAPWPRRALSNLKLVAAGLLLVVVAVMACFQPLASTLRNHRQVRYLINPLNVMWALGSTAFAGTVRSHDVRPIGEDAVTGHRFGTSRPPLLVLVLGETGRAGNFGLNGQGRDTTPVLAGEEVASFRNVWSCGTSTAVSVPCMFSRLPRATFFDRDHEEEGLLDVLQRAGYAVLWIDNQGGCKGVCDRVPTVSTDRTACPDGECLDGALLDGLDDRLAALPAERRARGVVLVMHQIGSHGPAYHRRSSPDTKRFFPECTHHELQACSREELVNAYDNSIVYTDWMLGQTVRWLERQSIAWSTAMVYVADHGESLGEKNLYLHGLPYAVAPDVQKRVPWITWMSPGFGRAEGLSTACLRGRADAELSHDHYFHSVLGLMDVRSSVYDARLDAYAACRDRGV